SASLTQRKVSKVPFVGSISPEGFLPLILLLVVIIARVVVTVVNVVAVGGVPSILKLSFMVIEFLLGLLVLAIVAACASRAVATLSATSFLMAAYVMADASDVDILLGGIYQHKITRNKNDITSRCQNFHT
nr:hypothetical protein [Tanacetum cinerariifolium]